MINTPLVIRATRPTVNTDLFVTALQLILLALAFFAAPVSANSQTPASPKPAPTPAASTPSTPGQKPEPGAPLPTGSIRGRLLADDGQPLLNANVTVQSISNTPSAKSASIDTEGRFVLNDLPASSYTIIVTAPGYIDEAQSYATTRHRPRYLIGANVTISMIRGGVITGAVTSARGDPVVGVTVQAHRSDSEGSRFTNFYGGGGSETDDRGIYRIYGLQPGQYLVTAGGKGSFAQSGADGFDNDVPTYYPSAVRDAAVPVSVRGGAATTGIDITYKGNDGYSISGVVIGAVEASAGFGAIPVFLSHAGTNSMLSVGIVPVADPRRAFTLNGIADGEYDLRTSFFSGPANNAWAATKRISVRGGDLSGVELRLAPLATIAGAITLEPIKPEDKCDKRGSQVVETILNLTLDQAGKDQPQSIISMFAGGLGTVNDRGEFAVRNLEAGRYRLELKLPSSSWYVAAINLPGAAAQPVPRDAQASQRSASAPSKSASGWQGTVTIKSGEQLNGVSLMVGQDAAGLRGRVKPVDEGVAIPVGTRVHLVPADRERANNIVRYGEALVNSDGSFALTNLAPGRYYLLARVEASTETDAAARPSAWDPVTRAALRRQAETTNAVVELKPCQRTADYELKLGG